MLPKPWQEWYGYTDDVQTTTMTMYLPDRDPEASNQGGQSCRLEVEATEMSLALIKEEIQDAERLRVRF